MFVSTGNSGAVAPAPGRSMECRLVLRPIVKRSWVEVGNCADGLKRLGAGAMPSQSIFNDRISALEYIIHFTPGEYPRKRHVAIEALVD